MSPLKIKILLSFHCSPDGYRGQSYGSPAYHDAMRDFVSDGLLLPYPCESGFALTYKGDDLVRRLIKVEP